MSNIMTPEQQRLMDEFEKMLNSNDDEQDDFEWYQPSDADLIYPDEPPPIPKEALECLHENKKYIVISINMKYWFCPDCKEEVEE